MRPRGGAQVLEDRRQKAIELLEAGHAAKEVAETLDTTVRSVRRWWRAYRESGDEALAARRTPGRPRSLTATQEQHLLRLLREGPHANGWPSDRWDAEMIAFLIAQRFGVDYHANHIARLLARLCTSVRELNAARPGHVG